MRAKNLLAVVPVPNIVKLLFERITVTRVGLFYFCFSLVYCIAQVAFQGWAFKINSEAGTRLSNIINASNVQLNVTVDGQLVVTDALALVQKALLQNNVTTTDSPPEALSLISTSTSTPSSPSASIISFPSSVSTPSSPSASIVSSPSSVRPRIVTRPTRTATPSDGDDDDDDDETKPGEYRAKMKRFTKRDDGIIRANDTGVFLHDGGETVVFLSNACIEDIVWPARTIHNTKREDVTFMAFQIWVMGMSVIALMNESIPHIFVVLITHILATTWSGFQISNTRQFNQTFQQTTLKADSCNVNLLPSYWSQRNAAEIAVLSINVIFLMSSIFFTHRLIKTFGWQTFKRIGASLEINRIYKVILMFSVALQLAFFCVLASMGLWIDFIVNTTEGQYASSPVLFKAIAAVVCVLMVPWMYLGWTSIYKESKVLMSIFIGVSLAMLGSWGGLFASTTFRRTFISWPFFASISTASCIFALICTTLGVICLTNFNKGLKHFLNAEEKLPGEDFAPVTQDLEKSPLVQFPSAATVPPFDVAFTTGPGRHSPGQSLSTVAEYDQTTLGSVGSIRRPPPARMPSNASSYNSEGLKRSGSNGSDHSTASSTGTIRTYAVAGSHHAIMAAHQNQNNTLNSNNAKRGWVIE
jgi:hypothetical protein